MGAVVEAVGWGWRHAGRRAWALRGLDLVIEAGERVLLLGPSGAGKSTLLGAIAGLLAAPESGDDEGRLTVAGRPAEEAHGGAGVVFQDPSSSIVMGRVGDEVAFGLENRSVPAAEIWSRVSAALGAVGLRHPLSHPTGWLSGGEQQRLAIADVVALAPDLWLLDEPTANLDPAGAAMVRDALRELLVASSATLVMVEHRVGPLLDMVDRVVVLEPGAGVMADGAPAEVFARDGAALRAAGIWVPGGAPGRLAPPRPAGRPVVATRALTVAYPGSSRPAVDGVDVTAYAGQVLAVTGSNGSGKTTLALALASLLAPSTGEVRFLAGGPDRPYARWRPRELVKLVGSVFQDPEHQFVAASVEAELAVGPLRSGVAGAEVRRRVGELLDLLALAHVARVNPFTLSGGEKRRLSVACALATDPVLLVLDEPTFAQDLRAWETLVALLADQRDAGRAVVVVTHDDALVRALADRRLEMERGKVTGPGARVGTEGSDETAPAR